MYNHHSALVRRNLMCASRVATCGNSEGHEVLAFAMCARIALRFRICAQELRDRGDTSWSAGMDHWTDDWPLLPRPRVDEAPRVAS